LTKVTDMGHPQSPDGKEILIPESRAVWRNWLTGNADRQHGLWIVYRKKSSELEGPIYEDLVEEALCFGWIDSKVQRLDGDRRMQWFSPRRRGGLWSSLNKERVQRLREQGLMTTEGQRVIDEAIADGSWSQADEVDALVVPQDLTAAFEATPGAGEAYQALSDSVKRQHLWWIHSARRASTRSSRIEELTRRLTEGD
jgi:uncharacterized protein YdeI (YjbR/CyaY-like superfamily)